MMEASFFFRLISLPRWADIAFFHSTKSICWPVTWSNLSRSSRNVWTSFEASALTVFSTKLCLKELPLLNLLQLRHPHTFKPEWKCFLCNNSNEDWAHFWSCSFSRNALQNLVAASKLQFEAALFTNSTCDSPVLPLNWNNLSCWTLPTSSSPQSFTFDFLLRGFCPTDLADVFFALMPKKEAVKVLSAVMTKAIVNFRSDVWIPRCSRFGDVSRIKGITLSSFSGHRPSAPAVAPASSSFSDFLNLSSFPRINFVSWQSWISDSVSSGLDWTGFHMRTNSLFHLNFLNFIF
jgi:hypothetical protein